MEAGCAGLGRKDVDPIAPGTRFRIGDAVPKLDRALVLGERFRKCIGGLGRKARGHGRFEGPRQVMRGVPVICELGDARRIAGRAGCL